MFPARKLATGKAGRGFHNTFSGEYEGHAEPFSLLSRTGDLPWLPSNNTPVMSCD
jgi:hypothetical protein